jgi:hypothetical protein
VLSEFWSADLGIKRYEFIDLTGRVWSRLAWTKLAPIEFQWRNFGQPGGREFDDQMSDYQLHSGLLLLPASRSVCEQIGRRGGDSSRSHRVQKESGNGVKAAGG